MTKKTATLEDVRAEVVWLIEEARRLRQENALLLAIRDAVNPEAGQSYMTWDEWKPIIAALEAYDLTQSE